MILQSLITFFDNERFQALIVLCHFLWTKNLSHGNSKILSNSKSSLNFTITDQGIGFEESNIKNILEPFYRIDVHSEQKGFGLGLTICDKIISAHNGNMNISSIPNEGSQFILSIPIKQ